MTAGKLNRTNWILTVRKGLAAAINAVTTYFLEGELGYTTDTKQLYISDGSDQLRVVTTDSSENAGVDGVFTISGIPYTSDDPSNIFIGVDAGIVNNPDGATNGQDNFFFGSGA